MTDLIEVSKITKRIKVRSVKTSGVEKLQDKINKLGFLPQHPLLVNRIENGEFELIDGNHRLDAAINLGLTALPGHILSNHLSDNDKKKFARQANEASETMIPTSFIDDAELIWKEAEQGKTQEEIAKDILGWGSDKVKTYCALKQIDPKAWTVIVPTFEHTGTPNEETVGTQKVPTGTFTEGLLRSILDLTPDQQLELVLALARGDIQKGQFKKRAEAYQARNDMKTYALERLGDLGEDFISKLIKEIYSGAYDTDWEKDNHPKLHRLIGAIHDEWEEKNSIHLIHGDFYATVTTIGSGTVDLILTDPPYNVANEREFILEGRTNISQDFGEWDKYEHQAF